MLKKLKLIFALTTIMMALANASSLPGSLFNNKSYNPLNLTSSNNVVITKYQDSTDIAICPYTINTANDMPSIESSNCTKYLLPNNFQQEIIQVVYANNILYLLSKIGGQIASCDSVTTGNTLNCAVTTISNVQAMAFNSYNGINQVIVAAGANALECNLSSANTVESGNCGAPIQIPGYAYGVTIMNNTAYFGGSTLKCFGSSSFKQQAGLGIYSASITGNLLESATLIGYTFYHNTSQCSPFVVSGTQTVSGSPVAQNGITSFNNTLYVSSGSTINWCQLDQFSPTNICTNYSTSYPGGTWGISSLSNQGIFVVNGANGASYCPNGPNGKLNECNNIFSSYHVDAITALNLDN